MKSSSSTDAPEAPEPILVGVILRPHGIRGEVVVGLHSDNPRRFASGAELRAVAPGRRSAPATLRVARSGPHRDGLRVAFDGVADRDAAEALRGVELVVERAELPEREGGSYYLFELVGCRCVDARDGDLGAVVDVVADGGGWLLEVEHREGHHGRRMSLPFVEAFVVSVDPAARRIELELPEGLVEACASAF